MIVATRLDIPALYTNGMDRDSMPDTHMCTSNCLGLNRCSTFSDLSRLGPSKLCSSNPAAYSKGKNERSTFTHNPHLHNTVSVLRMYWMLKVCQIMTVGTSIRNNYITMAPEGDSTICKMHSRDTWYCSESCYFI